MQEPISDEDLFGYGVVARVVQIHKDLKGKFVVTLEGFVRCKMLKFMHSSEVITATVQISSEPGRNHLIQM